MKIKCNIITSTDLAILIRPYRHKGPGVKDEARKPNCWIPKQFVKYEGWIPHHLEDTLDTKTRTIEINDWFIENMMDPHMKKMLFYTQPET